METKEKETELVQLIRQLRDYVILDKRDYEKIVQNSKPVEGALEVKDTQIEMLKKQLEYQEDWADYWKDKYSTCLSELKKYTTKWWKF